MEGERAEENVNAIFLKVKMHTFLQKRFVVECMFTTIPWPVVLEYADVGMQHQRSGWV